MNLLELYEVGVVKHFVVIQILLYSTIPCHMSITLIITLHYLDTFHRCSSFIITETHKTNRKKADKKWIVATEGNSNKSLSTISSHVAAKVQRQTY